jgi:putative flippase GtrA
MIKIPGLKPRTVREISRSVPVSFLSFNVDLGVLVVLTEVAHIFYLVSAAISFLLGVTVSYVLSVLWVFKTRRIPSKTLEFGLFILVGAIGLGLNEALLWFFTKHLGIFYLLSKIIVASIVFFWNFGARKYILFRETS